MAELTGSSTRETIRFVGARWATTRWSVIRRAGQGGERAALSVLCKGYWHPVHAFIRGHGLGHDEAQDVTQSFFAFILGRRDLAKVQPERGRFRSWLRTCARRYVLNHLKHARAQKMGGRARFISVEGEPQEALGLRADGQLAADRLFDRLWALQAVRRSLERLREEYVKERRGDVFDRLRSTLSDEERDDEARDTAATAHVVLSGAIRTKRNREKVEMRARYRRCLRAEVIATVTDPDAVVDEMRELFDALE
jgi:DNA-directed RNA polymerase specialized sigma24 family protein